MPAVATAVADADNMVARGSTVKPVYYYAVEASRELEMVWLRDLPIKYKTTMYHVICYCRWIKQARGGLVLVSNTNGG
jgi:hypothetical protein